METILTNEIIDDFNPLQENVQQREYTKPKVQGGMDASPIEEPIFTPPSFEELDAQFSQQKEKPISNEPDSANPYINNLDTKDQKNASKALVEAVLDGYTQLGKFGSKGVQIKIELIQQLMREGKIDSNLTVPVNGRNIPVIEYVTAYNAELSEVFNVDDEFKDKVRPVMLRIFMERNIGMTDMQLLMYYFGTDIVTKISVGYSLIKQNGMLIQSMVDISKTIQPTPKTEYGRVHDEHTDNFQAEPPITRSTVKKKEREYIEPEEISVIEEIQEVQEIKTANEDVKKGRRPVSQPEFGNSDLLAHMEEVANEGGAVKRRGRPRKAK